MDAIWYKDEHFSAYPLKAREWSCPRLANLAWRLLQSNPGAICLLHLSTSCVPCMQLNPPEIKDTPEAPRDAAERLQKMGPMSRDEKIMLGTMGLAVVLWVLGDSIGVASVTAAMLGESQYDTCSACLESFVVASTASAECTEQCVMFRHPHEDDGDSWCSGQHASGHDAMDPRRST